jgi:hypothetical protein
MRSVLLVESPPMPVPASAPLPSATTLQPVRCTKCARIVALAALAPGSVLELKCHRCRAMTLVVVR